MAVKQVGREIIKIGKSLGVTLPQEILDHIQIKQGDKVQLRLESNGAVTIKKFAPKDYSVLDDMDQDFLDGMKDLFDNYDNALRNLVNK